MARHHRPSRLRAFVGDHALFLVALVPAVVLRALATAAYHPGLFFMGDSAAYIGNAFRLVPQSVHPLGYAVFLRLVLFVHGLTLVVVVQHLLGLATACIGYALLRHYRIHKAVAVAGTLIVLLDPIQLVLEENVLAETLLEFLFVAALALVAWERRPRHWQLGLAGAALAAAAVTKDVGLFLVLPVLVFAVGRRLGLTRLATLAGAVALPLVAYAGWFDALYGHFNIQNFSGETFYGRVAPFVDCTHLTLSATDRVLCPRGQTSRWPTYYVYGPPSPFNYEPVASAPNRNQLAMGFAVTVVVHQPLDYALVVSKDFLTFFQPGRTTGADANPAQIDLVFRVHQLANFASPLIGQAIRLADGSPAAHGSIDTTLANAMSRYQRHFWFPGPLFALALGLGLLGPVLARRRQEDRRPLGAEALLFTTSALVLMLVSVATTVLDYRYLMPEFPMIGVAGAVGATLTLDRLRHRKAAAAATPLPDPDEALVEAGVPG
jgi:hypothetical protein